MKQEILSRIFGKSLRISILELFLNNEIHLCCSDILYIEKISSYILYKSINYSIEHTKLRKNMFDIEKRFQQMLELTSMGLMVFQGQDIF